MLSQKTLQELLVVLVRILEKFTISRESPSLFFTDKTEEWQTDVE